MRSISMRHGVPISTSSSPERQDCVCRLAHAARSEGEDLAPLWLARAFAEARRRRSRRLRPLSPWIWAQAGAVADRGIVTKCKTFLLARC